MRLGHWITASMALVALLMPRGARAQDEDERGHFHHVHLNVVDPEASIKYYERFFSGVRIKYRDTADAVLTDRSYILFNKVDSPAPSDLVTALYHMGWGGIDGPAEYEWRKKEGVQFESELATLGTAYYFYAYGPDKEVIEVWTGGGFHHNRFGHMHLLANDVNAAAKWYADNLNLRRQGREQPKPSPPPADFDASAVGASTFRYLWTSAVVTDNCVINIFGQPDAEYGFWWKYDPIEKLMPTQGRVIDHMAFSFRDIEPVLERMKANGVEIVKPISVDPKYKLKSFFVMGPDSTLIEVVEAAPLPYSEWD